ncbi:hypothetical protein P5673_015931 [Acropora cervicornis]|uniref:Uncharacterized protein n=1 Tax=Acropora cervicornis TaxID=6130 RepID=A0AAD9QI96_ACRCE|nr:hypothetical protein P5673_015931 [Acropora cervicornis]
MLDWRIKGDYDICTPTTIARNGRFGNLITRTRLGQGMSIIFCLTGVWHSFYCYQNRSLSIQKRSPKE